MLEYASVWTTCTKDCLNRRWENVLQRSYVADLQRGAYTFQPEIWISSIHVLFQRQKALRIHIYIHSGNSRAFENIMLAKYGAQYWACEECSKKHDLAKHTLTAHPRDPKAYVFGVRVPRTHTVFIDVYLHDTISIVNLSFFFFIKAAHENSTLECCFEFGQCGAAVLFLFGIWKLLRMHAIYAESGRARNSAFYGWVHRRVPCSSSFAGYSHFTKPDHIFSRSPAASQDSRQHH